MRGDGQSVQSGGSGERLGWGPTFHAMSVIPLTIFFSLLLAGPGRGDSWPHDRSDDDARKDARMSARSATALERRRIPVGRNSAVAFTLIPEVRVARRSVPLQVVDSLRLFVSMYGPKR